MNRDREAACPTCLEVGPVSLMHEYEPGWWGCPACVEGKTVNADDRMDRELSTEELETCPDCGAMFGPTEWHCFDCHDTGEVVEGDAEKPCPTCIREGLSHAPDREP